MKIKLLGIDLAKNIFQVRVLNQANKVVFNRKVKRAQLPEMIANIPPALLAMESCSSANY
jgi:transposase